MLGFARRLAMMAWPLLAGLVLAGCGGRPSQGPAAAGRVAVRVIDQTDLARVLKQYQGKVVLVDFWATWCGPCVQLFPHTVELHRRLADRGLAVISVSVDDPEDEPAVLGLLVANGATFDNFISRYGTGSRSTEAFQLGEGSLPLLKLYDRQGRLRKTFGAAGLPIDPESIDHAVEELLGER